MLSLAFALLKKLNSVSGSRNCMLEGDGLSNLEVPAILQNCCQYIIQNGIGLFFNII